MDMEEKEQLHQTLKLAPNDQKSAMRKEEAEARRKAREESAMVEVARAFGGCAIEDPPPAVGPSDGSGGEPAGSGGPANPANLYMKNEIQTK